MRGVNDHEAAGAAAVLPGSRLRASVHRADAAGRPARLAARGHGHGRRDPGGARHRVQPDPGGSAAARLGARPRRSWWTAARRLSASSASVTRPFCGACDRIRLTADGQLRNCLFARPRTTCGRRCAPERPTTSSSRSGSAASGQAARPRHQRSWVPAARPADVGHRRLSGRSSRRDRAGRSEFDSVDPGGRQRCPDGRRGQARPDSRWHRDGGLGGAGRRCRRQPAGSSWSGRRGRRCGGPDGAEPAAGR